MKALDLFCCSGGSSMGLHNAGFEVEGVDINPELSRFYPFKITHKDVFDLEEDCFRGFDFIWASPPCQNYSIGTKGFRNAGKEYPDLVDKTRKLLDGIGNPYVIENVPGAPIRKDLMLCGSMFNLRVIRHRRFELSGISVPQIKHEKHKGSVRTGEYIVCVTGVVNPGCFGKRAEYQKIYGEIWKENHKIENWKKAMGINWIDDRKALAEAVPPAYAKYIGEWAIKQLK